jgi:hypothetical protein
LKGGRGRSEAAAGLGKPAARPPRRALHRRPPPARLCTTPRCRAPGAADGAGRRAWRVAAVRAAPRPRGPAAPARVFTLLGPVPSPRSQPRPRPSPRRLQAPTPPLTPPRPAPHFAPLSPPHRPRCLRPPGAPACTTSQFCSPATATATHRRAVTSPGALPLGGRDPRPHAPQTGCGRQRPRRAHLERHARAGAARPRRRACGRRVAAPRSAADARGSGSSPSPARHGGAHTIPPPHARPRASGTGRSPAPSRAPFRAPLAGRSADHPRDLAPCR